MMKDRWIEQTVDCLVDDIVIDVEKMALLNLNCNLQQLGRHPVTNAQERQPDKAKPTTQIHKRQQLGNSIPLNENTPTYTWAAVPHTNNHHDPLSKSQSLFGMIYTFKKRPQRPCAWKTASQMHANCSHRGKANPPIIILCKSEASAPPHRAATPKHPQPNTTQPLQISSEYIHAYLR